MKPHAKLWGLLSLVCLVILGLSWNVALAQDEQPPRLRVVNASLGVPNADVYVNQTLYFENVFYGYISNYVPVGRDNQNVRILPAGIKDSSPVVEWTGNFEANRDHTMIILGSVENIDAPWVLTDNNSDPIPPGQTRVRIIHAAGTAPALEFCLENRCETLTYRDTTEGYLTLDAGTYNLKIRLIGTDDLHLYKLPVAFAAGQVHSIFIFDPKQGEVKPRIIPHIDTGQKLPHYPDHPGSYPPPLPGPGYPPLYPPVTGAFLSPTALVVLSAVGFVLIAAGVWLVRRQFLKL